MMRRVYDDREYDEVSREIMREVFDIGPREVSEYRNGMDRASVSMIRDLIAAETGYIFTRNTHAYGIGNNNAYEIVIEDIPAGEERICGLFHLTNDMFGGVICWVSDIDGGRKTGSRKICP